MRRQDAPRRILGVVSDRGGTPALVRGHAHQVGSRRPPYQMPGREIVGEVGREGRWRRRRYVREPGRCSAAQSGGRVGTGVSREEGGRS
jgi:hypothetical protein